MVSEKNPKPRLFLIISVYSCKNFKQKQVLSAFKAHFSYCLYFIQPVQKRLAVDMQFSGCLAYIIVAVYKLCKCTQKVYIRFFIIFQKLINCIQSHFTYIIVFLQSRNYTEYFSISVSKTVCIIL